MKTFARILFILLLHASLIHATTAPDFSLPTPAGPRLSLSSLLERGPVLLDFWATWCKPCIKAMPKLQEIHDKYAKRGLTVLGVNEDGPRGQNRVRPFLRSRKLTFPNVIDGDGSVMKRFQARAMPTTILVASDGEIVLRITCIGDEEALTQAIEAVLEAPHEE